MGKQLWKAGNMLYPLPAVMVSTGDAEGKYNILTVAWTGTICSDPPMLYVSVRKNRYSHQTLMQTGEFFVNLTTEATAFATDYCGVKSGRDTDKFKVCNLTAGKCEKIDAPQILEAPISLECKVIDVKTFGTHDMFLAEIVAVDVDDKYINQNGALDIEKAGLIAYAHGFYYTLGRKLGKFGFSVEKKKTIKKRKAREQQK